MISLDPKTNYNVLLTHFLDSSSKWSVYVNGANRDYLLKEFDISQDQLKNIQDYANKRAPYDWEEMASIYGWAYNGFEKGKFEDLKPHILEFETYKSKNGKTIESILKTKLPTVQNYAEHIKTSFNSDIDTLYKIAEVFPINTQAKTVEVFVGYSFKKRSMQGGANGDAISTEVFDGMDAKAKKQLMSLVLHEAIHFIFKFSKHLEKIDPRYIEIYNKGETPDRKKSNVMEEALVRTIEACLITKSPYKGRFDNLCGTILYSGYEAAFAEAFAFRFGKDLFSKYFEHKITKEELIEKLSEEFFRLTND